MSNVLQPGADERRPPIRVAVSVPAGDDVSTGFAYDLARMMAYTAATTRLELRLVFERGSLLPNLRRDLAMGAIATDSTHVLFLDSDMRFPKDTLVRLLTHDVDVVAANYPRRSHPVAPTARAAELVYDDGGTELVPVHAAGMGVMLIKTEVFATMEQPWFALPSAEDGSVMGEDHFFCTRAIENGRKVLIDPALSRQVSHIGEFEFTLAHAAAYRESASAV